MSEVAMQTNDINAGGKKLTIVPIDPVLQASIRQYCGIKKDVPLPLHHTNVDPIQAPVLPQQVSVSTLDIILELQKKLHKGFQRARHRKKGIVEVKLGFFPKTWWKQLIKNPLKEMNPQTKSRKSKSTQYCYCFNLKYLEYLFGSGWFCKTIYVKHKGINKSTIEGYVLVNDLLGVRFAWSARTTTLKILLPIRFTSEAGYRQFG